MSVMIKGMKMPKSCNTCQLMEGNHYSAMCHASSKWLEDYDYWIWGKLVDGSIDANKPLNCPLVPVPPHGRLIDADGEVGVNVTMMPGGKCRVDLIAPTIIPVEEGET